MQKTKVFDSSGRLVSLLGKFDKGTQLTIKEREMVFMHFILSGSITINGQELEPETASEFGMSPTQTH
jgi:hypothetical protein